MNKLKAVGAATIVAAKVTTQDWLFILSIAITVLGMIQTYFENRDIKRDNDPIERRTAPA